MSKTNGDAKTHRMIPAAIAVTKFFMVISFLMIFIA